MKTLLVPALLLLTLPAHANDSSRALAAMSAAEQKNTLQRLLTASGKRCPAVTRAFYQGIDRDGAA